MSSSFHRLAIVGAGALGGYYGARLALQGHDVHFVMRSGLEEVRAHGWTLREQDGNRHLPVVSAHADSAAVGPVDLVVITLKTTANDSLRRLLPPLLRPGTAVLTLQNGLGQEEWLAGLVGAERVYGGLCYIAVTRGGPGELVGFHTPGAMTFGACGRPADATLHDIAAVFAGIGVRTRVLDRLAEARWQKLVWNIPFNGLAIAGGGVSTDRILADPALAGRVRPLMDEVAAAARALGHEVTEAFIQSQIDVTPGMGAYRPSSLVDYLAGRPVEIEAIWGEPLRQARAAGVPTPRLAELYEELVRLTARRA